MKTDEIGILFQLYSANSSTEANLWMMYVAATLACAGFGISTNTLTNMRMALIASLGFIAFAVGQFLMVIDVVEARQILQGHLAALTRQPSAMRLVVDDVGALGLTVDGAALTHAVVDTVIVALIMYRPTSLASRERVASPRAPRTAILARLLKVLGATPVLLPQDNRPPAGR